MEQFAPILVHMDKMVKRVYLNMFMPLWCKMCISCKTFTNCGYLKNKHILLFFLEISQIIASIFHFPFHHYYTFFNSSSNTKIPSHHITTWLYICSDYTFQTKHRHKLAHQETVYYQFPYNTQMSFVYLILLIKKNHRKIAQPWHTKQRESTQCIFPQQK